MYPEEDGRESAGVPRECLAAYPADHFESFKKRLMHFLICDPL